MSNESVIRDLLAGTEFDDPRLYDLLDKMLDDFYKVYYNLYPAQAARVFGLTGSTTAGGSVTGFTATLFGNNLRLTWNNLTNATSYEIRYHYGTSTDWDSGTSLITTATLSADINPVTLPLIYGNHTFLIKASDLVGAVSAESSSVSVNIPQITSPVITPTVIDNFVLLKWSVPVSVLNISYYNVYKDGTLIGKMDGTFEAIFETVSGTFEYKIEAVDIVGNVGTPSTISVSVNQPPDYELTDNRDSLFNGTFSNTILDGGKIFGPISDDESWEDHFDDNSWESPQDQIDDGFPLYAQPTPMTGYYEEVIDYGVLVTNTIVTVIFGSHELSPSVNIVVSISTSEDGVTYTSPVNGVSLFAASLQFAKIRVTFNGSDNDALATLDSLGFRLDVKREMDSGSVDAVASDIDGTEVFFNKAFKDIDSITLTVRSSEPITAVYAFTDVPNPVSFFVYALDSTGNRVDYHISWKARGIV